MPSSELVPSRDVATRLGVHVRTVHKMVKKGDITPAVVAPGYRGDFLFDPDDVEALAAQRSAS